MMTRERGGWRTAQMKLSPIKEIELEASRIPGVVSLAQGIPSFDTPEPIKAFVQQKIAAGACARYSLTPGLPQLRELIGETLLPEGMHYDPESEIIFVFPRVKDTVPWARDSRRLAYDILQQARVALVPGVAFGPAGEAHLRINFSRREKTLCSIPPTVISSKPALW
ncbi:MAG: hypothetical protein HYZ72_06310 [Deltaproteobacteria bacterium]|nr:hypothetical protein [Deltaproteobacteria bacterium]